MSRTKPSWIARLESWKPLTELALGGLGLLISAVALSISLIALVASRSAPDITLRPGRDFGVTLLRGNHLPSWHFPDTNYPASERYLVVAFSVVFSNAGARQGIVDHLWVEVTRLEDGQSVYLDWKTFFEVPKAADRPENIELVTPLVVPGNSSAKRLIMFLSDHGSDLERFFRNGSQYRFAFGIHTADMSSAPGQRDRKVFALEWHCNEHRKFNIDRKTFGPRQKPPVGTSALLTLY